MQIPSTFRSIVLAAGTLFWCSQMSTAQTFDGWCVDDSVTADNGQAVQPISRDSCAQIPSSGEADTLDTGIHLGFPVYLGTPTNGQSYTPTIKDGDRDGADEIFVTGGYTFAIRGDGSFLPGWPSAEQPSMGYGTTFNIPGPSVADFHPEGKEEVLWTTRDWWAQDSRLWTFNARSIDGSDLSGFPREAPDVASNALSSTFVLGDLDDDGDLQAWAAHSYGNTNIESRISALDSQGRLLFTVDLDPFEDVQSLHFGDLDGDRDQEFFAISWLSPALRLHVFEQPGVVSTSYPLILETVFPGTVSLGPAVPADLDDDGDLEILTGSWSDDRSVVHCRNHDGFLCAGFPIEVATDSQLLYIALGNIAGTREPELIAMERWFDGSNRVFAIDLQTGEPLPGWPRSFPNATKGLPAIVDVTGDGSQEVCFTTFTGQLYALAEDGSVVEGYPKQMTSFSLSGVAAGDIDDDGLIELVAATWDGWVYAWDTAGVARYGNMDWPMRGVNPRNTGVFGDAEGLVFASDFEVSNTSRWTSSTE